MRGPAVLVATLLLATAIALPARAAGVGTIKGHVLEKTSSHPLAGVKVTLSGTDRSGGKPLLLQTRTDADGSYSFSRLPTGKDHLYVLDAHYQHGLFAGRAIAIPSNTRGQPVIDTTLRVWPTIANPAAIVVDSDDLFVVPNDKGLAIIESVHVTNQTDHA